MNSLPLSALLKKRYRSTQIATAAEEQTTATAEISNNMRNITEGSEELAAKIDSVQQDIQNTENEIEQLIKVVNKFDIS